VAVVLPAYNEEGLGEFLVEIEAHLAPVTADLSFAVVDDCSTRPLELTSPVTTLPLGSKVVVSRNRANLGHGPSALAAYRLGLSHAPDVVIHVDGDGHFLGEDFPRILDAVRLHDGAVGARAGRREAWYRRALSRAARICVGEALTGRDVNSPLRAYQVNTLRRLVDRVPPESTAPHLLFAVLHQRLKLDVVEIDVVHRARRGLCETGTTWQGQGMTTLWPSRRLISVAWRAWRELRTHPGSENTAPAVHHPANAA
jgi:glycosyltransferase involved in cell wall biosynthesis